MKRVECPVCGRVFEPEDLHKPFRCPRCGSLLHWRGIGVEVLYTAEELVGERG